MLITIYFLRYVLCALAMGVLMVRCRVLSCMSKRTGFLLGAASTPFCIAVIVYIVCLIAPGTPSILLMILPVLISVIYLFTGESRKVLKSLAGEAAAYMKNIVGFLAKHKVCAVIPVILAVCFLAFLLLTNRNYKVYTLLRALRWKHLAAYATGLLLLAALVFCFILYRIQKSRRTVRFDEGLLLKMAQAAGLFIILVVTAFKIYYSGQTNIFASDPSHYYAQANYFAESRDAREIDHYSGEKEGTIFKDDHGYLWPVWLGDGRFFMEAGEDSLNPAINKITVCIVFLSFLLALFAVTWEVVGSGLLAGLSISLISLYRDMEYLILVGSRDAFRFLGMLLLLAVCVNGIMTAYRRRHESKSEKKKFQRQDALEVFFTGLFAYFCIEGHEGNIYLMLGLFIVYGVILLLLKTSFFKLCLLALSAGVGTVLGITKAIDNFITSGTLASSTGVVFHDTKVLDTLQETASKRGDWAAIAETYYLPELLLIFVGILSMLFLIIKGVRNRVDKEGIRIFAVAACLFGLLLPMFGVFDFLGYAFSKWTIEQARYRMYFMVLLSIAVCFAVHLLWEKKKSLILRYGILCFNLLVISIAPFSQTSSGPITTREVESYNNRVGTYNSIVGTAAKEKAQERQVYVDDQVLAYYCNCDAKLLYHSIAEPLIQAKTDEEIETALEKLNIGVIVLNVESMYHDYSLLPMWEYINNSDYADTSVIPMITGEKWILYQIKK